LATPQVLQQQHPQVEMALLTLFGRMDKQQAQQRVLLQEHIQSQVQMPMAVLQLHQLLSLNRLLPSMSASDHKPMYFALVMPQVLQQQHPQVEMAL
jgi:hypothetical protein